MPKINYSKTKKNEVNLLLGIIITVVVLLVAFSCKGNLDDSFYVSLSESSLDCESIYMEEPSTGYKSEKVLVTVTEQLPTIELQIAIFCKVASINAAAMSHSIIAIIVICISYISLYYFARSFMDDKNAKIFLCVISVVLLFAGFSTKFRTGCLFMKPWQGKAILLNIAVPVILGCLIRIDEDLKKEEIILLIIANLFSIALSSTAIFLVTFMYLPFIILKLIKGKWKDVFYLGISFIPLFCHIAVYVYMNSKVQVPFDVPKDVVSIFESINYFNSKIYIIYYIVATMIILIWGEKQAKRYFGIVQLINVLTIWNPLFSNWIATHFTSSAIFWRVLWLVPLEYAISYAIIVAIQMFDKKYYKVLVSLVSLAILVTPGKFIYENADMSQNLENVPQTLIEQASYILENSNDEERIMVLSPSNPHNVVLRQLSNKFNLMGSRDCYREKIQNNEVVEDRDRIMEIYNGNYIYTTDEFKELIKKYSVDWIIVCENDERLNKYIEDSGLCRKKCIDKYVLYKSEW